MKTFTPALIVCGIAGTIVAAGIATATPTERPALLPSGRSTLVEVHPEHAAKNVECSRCHTGAKSSAWASERLAPRMEGCAPCHPEAREVTPLTPVVPTCRKCHGPLEGDRPPTPAFYPQPLVRFSHKAHATSSCSVCHDAKSASDAIPTMPKMRTCYDCHRKLPGSAAECRRCHLVQGDGRMNTRLGGIVLLPPAWLIGPNHGSGWSGEHAVTSGSNSSLCASCHEPRFCQDCHSGTRRPRNLHPGDWLRTHGTSTRFDNPHCQGCHRTQSFCLTCHRRAGVATDSPSATAPPQGKGRLHGPTSVPELMRRGKKDITSCVACHTESSCIDCHSMVNPHPAAWKRRCAKIAPRAETACRKCHTEGADRCR